MMGAGLSGIAPMRELVRFPAVAGTFYPASRAELDALVTSMLSAVEPGVAVRRPKAVIVPHAGYIYSGAVAASAFARVAPFGASLRRVLLVGPAHRVRVDGLASPGVSHLRTPLGDVMVDLDALGAVPEIAPNAAVHAREHSLEVELPFLQKVAAGAKVVPIAVGAAEPMAVARVIEALWGGPETLVVISSDLSHYLPYDDARAVDRRTADRVLALDPKPLTGEDACGATGINGLLVAARGRGLAVELADLRNSGDTAGSRHEVVGYGAFALYEAS
jgi:AmmeMemoRadiSam system protein B